MADSYEEEQLNGFLQRMTMAREEIIAKYGDDPAEWPLPFPMYALDADRNVVECKTMGEFIRTYGSDQQEYERRRIVGQTQVTPEVRVSTVFIGIDLLLGLFGRLRPEPLKPRVFETMCFGGPLDGERWKHTSYEDALRGHADAVMEVESALLQQLAEKRTALH